MAQDNSVQKENRSKPALKSELVFALLHLSPLFFITKATWFDWSVCIFLYFARMWFITAGYHRYFSHKTFKTSRWFQFLLAFGAQTSMQKGALWWAANHRVHHQYSDTPKDPHSAKVYGFWYSHWGWILGTDFKNTLEKRIGDLTRFKELVWLNKFYLVPVIALILVVYFLGNYINGTGFFDWSGGLSTIMIGFLFSTVILYHGTYSINSLMHKWGKRRFNTKDESKNNAFLAFFTLGEGWHNNHHYYAASARNGFLWWEFDITYYGLKILSMLGLIWDLQPVPQKVLAKRNDFSKKK